MLTRWSSYHSVPTGLRNRALLLLGFAGAFRRSQLEALNMEDVKLTNPVAEQGGHIMLLRKVDLAYGRGSS
jgi:site-specific recombinase XerD